MLVWHYKDPDEVLDYPVDWKQHPMWQPGDVIESASFSLATAAGMTIAGTTHDNRSLSVVTLSGGTVGSRGKVLCQVTTEEGQTLQQTATVLIRAR